MTKILQIKISLDYSKPKIWRRFLVEDNISFHKLHEIIQEVMGWDNYHLYSFYIGETQIQMPDPDYVDEYGSKNSKRTKLNKLLNSEKQKFGYIYDFGDYWEHTIVIEKILDRDDGEYPVCIAGKMACPPEDCGSITGYYRLLHILADKSHEEHKDMVNWVGGKFDPEEFDIEEINKRLRS